jgi:hypothetical protein
LRVGSKGSRKCMVYLTFLGKSFLVFLSYTTLLYLMLYAMS